MIEYAEIEWEFAQEPDAVPLPTVDEAVRAAGRKLEPREWALVEEMDFMGWSQEQAAWAHRLTLTELRRLHDQAMARLHDLLAGYVFVRFGIEPPWARECMVCIHPQRYVIEVLIDAKPPTTTWAAFMAALRERYDLPVRSPQTLIQHNRKHRNPLEEEPWPGDGECAASTH